MILQLLIDGQFPDELLEEAFEGCPEEWDGDGSADSILVSYIRHLESEVQRLGGCLKPHCLATEDPPEPCDHGYRS